MRKSTSQIEATLRQLATERILILDGAMGTMIQRYKLDEAGYRGERFKDYGRDIKGNNELLSITQPQVISEIHEQYLARRRRYCLDQHFRLDPDRAGRLRHGGDRLRTEPRRREARQTGRQAAEAEDGKPRFVAGAIGPTNRTASISPDVLNPSSRSVTFDELRIAYTEQVRGLLDGGVDALLIETIFDTLNAKAAIFAIAEELDARGIDVPVMISGTITDRSGRILSGQTPEAFWNSVAHATPLSVGLNCALGAKEMRAHIAELAPRRDTLICAYPNAGLPNEFGHYDEAPRRWPR